MDIRRKKQVLLLPMTLAMVLAQSTPSLANETDFEEISETEPTQSQSFETETQQENLQVENEASRNSLYQLQLDYQKMLDRYNKGATGLKDDLAELKEEVDSYAAQEMYRLYNPNSGEHFYTASNEEKNNLTQAGWSYEGVGWYAPVNQGVDVYRLYNPNGEHHYTLDENERDHLVEVGWKYEGVGWKSLDEDDPYGQALYRQYNPNQTICNHNYTSNLAEHQALVSVGWRDEHTAWYGVDVIHRDVTDGEIRFYRADTMEQITGFFNYQGSTYYLDPANDGSAVQNEKALIDGKYYLFDNLAHQIRSKGRVDFNGETYWMNSDYSIATGTTLISKEITGQPSRFYGFDEQGTLVRNGEVNGQQTDGNGMIANPNADQTIKQLCHDVYAETGTGLEPMFQYVKTHMRHVGKNPQWYAPIEGYTFTQSYALEGWRDGSGNCYSFASMFYHLAKEAGYDIRFVKGGVQQTRGVAEHGWTELTQNGRVYIVDTSFTVTYPDRYCFMVPTTNTPFIYIRYDDSYNYQ